MFRSRDNMELRVCQTRRETYQIRQRIQFLSHERRFVPPPGNFAIHKVEEKSKGHERERCPQISIVVRVTKTVTHRREDGHDSAETYCSYHKVLPPNEDNGHEGRAVPLRAVTRSARWIALKRVSGHVLRKNVHAQLFRT